MEASLPQSSQSLLEIAQNIEKLNQEVVSVNQLPLPESLLQHFTRQQELLQVAKELPFIKSNPEFARLAAVAQEALTNVIQAAPAMNLSISTLSWFEASEVMSKYWDRHLESQEALRALIEAAIGNTLPKDLKMCRRSNSYS
ncbi:MAG: hypothetical protein LBJ77_01240 [Holosporales bacterium]|nr:hypothetical protein [Holosporales bacterium]